MVIFTSQTFISANGGIFSLDQNGQRKPFVFGKPLVDDARKAPFMHSGLAAINARCDSNEAVLARNYSELVARFARNIGSRAAAKEGGAKAWSALEFVKEMAREVQDDTGQPHPGFVWDLKAAKHTRLFVLFIYDVASALGVPAGAIAGTTEISLFLCGKGVRLDKGKHFKVGERLEGDKGANAPVYDQAELQSMLYSMAASEKAVKMEYDEALLLYRKALALCPENTEARCGAASALLYIGKYQEALGESRLASSINPYLGEAHNLSGLALAWMGDHDGAIERYLDAVVHAGSAAKRATYYYNAAVSYFNMGQLNDAKNSCSKCIALEKDFAEAYKLRGEAYRELGMNMQADADLRRYNDLTGGKGSRDRLY